MARPKLTLFVDVISPFAYMAFHVTRTHPVFQQCDITYTPVLLGGIMKACDNRPPLEIKNKDKYIQRDLQRWRKEFNVPKAATNPQPFPQPTLQAQRALCAVELMYPEKMADVIAAFFTAFFVDLKTIGKPEVFGPTLQKVLGEADAAKLMEKIGSPEVKKLLSANTDSALKQGAFGLPWFVATNAEGQSDGFWGMNDLGRVVDQLGLDRKGQGFRAML